MRLRSGSVVAVNDRVVDAIVYRSVIFRISAYFLTRTMAHS
jgi:hypothetical protein